MKKVLLTAFIAFLCVFVSHAAKIDGKWKTSMENQDGNMEITFVFKVDGEKLTGTVSTPMGEMAISNGKISGNDFSFDVDMGGMALTHKGKIDGEVLKMKVDMPQDFGAGSPGEMTLTKVE
jgi:hypothetical protein